VSNLIKNYDGGITTSPQELVYPETVEQIQAVLRDTGRYPSPVRAMGSYHSLTPCASSDGTVLNMTRMNKIIRIDKEENTLTAQAGLQIIDGSKALRALDLQFMTNIEIGNLTLGSAACCHTKDSLDGIEFGQVGSYITAIKWVTPAGGLAEASEETDPGLLRMMRSSYGLCGVIYEVTIRVKPIEALHFTYLPRPLNELTEAEIESLTTTSQGLVCWTINRTCIFQIRHRIETPGVLGSFQAAIRRGLWNYGRARAAHLVDTFLHDDKLRTTAEQGLTDVTELLYSTLNLTGGISLLAPDKTVDYRHTPDSAKYVFTFWSFPKAQWLGTMRAYLDFTDEHFKATGFRCNMPLGSYYIRQDDKAILSYSNDGDTFSIDPIHANTNDAAWERFLREFNEFSYRRKGCPLLNQSPFVERKHVEAAYGRRWFEFSAWVRKMDPNGRMLNPFFVSLLSSAAEASQVPISN
jgi:hypothetical protein